jgi:hypothetical protein
MILFDGPADNFIFTSFDVYESSAVQLTSTEVRTDLYKDFGGKKGYDGLLGNSYLSKHLGMHGTIVIVFACLIELKIKSCTWR